MSRTSMHIRIATSLALVLILCVNTMAQGTANEEAADTGSLDTTIPAQLQAAIYNLKPDKRTRLQLTSGRRIEAPHRRHTRDSLYLASSASEEGVSASEIDGIWVRGNSAGRGALTGGAMCGVLLGSVALMSFDEGSSGAQDWSRGGAVLVLGLVGFVVGAGIGALVGAIPRWQRKY